MRHERTGLSASDPALPAWQAFLVQFTRETDGGQGTFPGRVEHSSSGRRARFETPRERLALLRRLLEELGESTL